MSTDARNIVIVGGPGKVGKRVADRLSALRNANVRFASRSTSPPFHWERPATWPAALRNAHAAFVAFQPDLALPAAADAIQSLAEIANRQGLARIVLLSGRGEEGALEAERRLATFEGEWTVVRCSWFSQNFSETFLADQVRSGEVSLPVGTMREPFIDARDIAEVVGAALMDAGHAGETYELTGPEALTFAEAVEAISAALGREVIYRQVTPGRFRERLLADGVDRELADLLVELFSVTMDGRNAAPADGVERALGRPPRSFADYALQTVREGKWAV